MSRASDVLRKAQPLGRVAQKPPRQVYPGTATGAHPPPNPRQRINPQPELQWHPESAPAPKHPKPRRETERAMEGEIIPPYHPQTGDEDQVNKYYESLTKSGKNIDETPVEVDKSKLLDVFKEMSK